MPGLAAAKATAVQLAALNDAADVFVGDTSTFFAAPATMRRHSPGFMQNIPMPRLLRARPMWGLWITKQLRTLPKIIHLGRTKGLDKITDEGPHISIGATATYAER